jgi:hypothetical protein
MSTGEKGGENKGVGSDWGKWVFFVVGELFFMVVMLGMVLYLVAQYKKDSFHPFELATVVGLLGGFIFVAAFAERVVDTLSIRLKRIGSLYLLSTISFVIFGLYQAGDQAQLLQAGESGSWIMKWVYPFTFYTGAVSFIVAMLLTLWVIPGLMEPGALWDAVRRIFGGKPKENLKLERTKMEKEETAKTYTLESIGKEVDKIEKKLDEWKLTATAQTIIGVGSGSVIALMIAGNTTNNMGLNWAAVAVLIMTVVYAACVMRRRKSESPKVDEKK